MTVKTSNTLRLLLNSPVQAALIGIIVAGVAGSFAYTAGWLTPGRLGGDRLTDAFERPNGPHAGFRRAHAKGICISGTFVPSAQASSLSKAAVFRQPLTPVIGRLAESSPDPFAKDAANGVRSMALALRPSGADAEWRTAMNDTPGLSVNTPQGFYDQLIAGTPDPRTGKPDPAKMAAFLAAHPEAVAFLARARLQPLAASFAQDSYNGIDGFIFVDGAGKRRLVRWAMVSEAPFSTLTPEQRARAAPNYLFDGLLADVQKSALHWKLVATVAAPGDVNLASVLWPPGRPAVDMGELTINQAFSEAARNCQDLVFDPLILPAGIEPSDDPIPSGRSAVYATSFRRRSGETKPPSAVAGQSAESGQ